jgi:uncharacterized membrane protein
VRGSQDHITGSRITDGVMLAACCTTLATLVPVTLFQIGASSRLPDPPMPIFDSERIVSSPAAHPLDIPDGLLGLASFGTTLALILLSRRSRSAKKLLGFKLSLDVAAAVFNAEGKSSPFVPCVPGVLEPLLLQG